MVIIDCRLSTPGIVSDGWQTLDRPRMVVIIRLTRFNLSNPIEAPTVITTNHVWLSSSASLGSTSTLRWFDGLCFYHWKESGGTLELMLPHRLRRNNLPLGHISTTTLSRLTDCHV